MEVINTIENELKIEQERSDFQSKQPQHEAALGYVHLSSRVAPTTQLEKLPVQQ